MQKCKCKEDYIEIIHDGNKIFYGEIKTFLKDKKSINGIIESWYTYIENCDYPVYAITLKNDLKN